MTLQMSAIQLSLLLMLFVVPVTGQAAESDDLAPTQEDLRSKALLLNVAVAGGILVWGTVNWDYFDSRPNATSEGWFGHATKEGGSDKLGHMYITHITSRAFRKVYLDWGYSERDAGRLGIWSSLGVMTLMEAGDSFSSDYGFSYEDMLMNLAGAGFSYLMEIQPDLDRKLDMRVEYWPEFGSDSEFDVFTDYQHLKYLLALKAEGFDSIRNPWLQALELHLGYYAREYGRYGVGEPDLRQRTLYAGLGINIGYLLNHWVETPVFDYLQLPYTYLPLEHDFD